MLFFFSKLQQNFLFDHKHEPKKKNHIYTNDIEINRLRRIFKMHLKPAFMSQIHMCMETNQTKPKQNTINRTKKNSKESKMDKNNVSSAVKPKKEQKQLENYTHMFY